MHKKNYKAEINGNHYINIQALAFQNVQLKFSYKSSKFHLSKLHIMRKSQHENF